MRIQRTIPPSAPTIYFRDLFSGLAAMINGKGILENFEDEVKEYFGVRHVFFVSSGKAALTLILQALKSLAPEKKDVVIPAYTCFSVPSAITKAGLKISPCDVNSSNFDYDFRQLEETYNDNTLCIIASHLFGFPSDVNKINSLCWGKGVFVIEDAAQAMGVTYNGQKLGTIGDLGFFSLGRGKNITCGDGGIIVTNSDRTAKAIAKLYSRLEMPDHWEDSMELSKLTAMKLFINPSIYWLPSGLPFLRLGETIYHKDFPIKRLSKMKAGIMKRWRKRLEKSNEIRRGSVEYYCKTLRFLKGAVLTPCVRMPVLTANGRDRDKILSVARHRRLGISKMYPSPINEVREIKDMFKGKDYPVAKSLSERLITIPTHQYLREKEKKDICEIVNSIMEVTCLRS